MKRSNKEETAFTSCGCDSIICPLDMSFRRSCDHENRFNSTADGRGGDFDFVKAEEGASVIRKQD